MKSRSQQAREYLSRLQVSRVPGFSSQYCRWPASFTRRSAADLRSIFTTSLSFSFMLLTTAAVQTPRP